MRRRLLSFFVIVLVAAGATGVWFYAQGRGGTPKYRVARVERGPLTATVSATGNLNAVITVQVGSQVSGQIKELLADFNSQVKKGQLIARIDPDILEAKANQAKADLENAQAAVLNQTANLERARAEVDNARAALAGARAQTAKAQVVLLDAKRDLDRKTELLRKELISQSDKDTSQANHDSAAAQLEAAQAQERALASQIRMSEAQLGVAQALLKAAQAQVKQKKAALDQALVDLDHTLIRAPVDGTVVSRNVDVGQTVAASLQAPTLFTIAQDLTQMQVDTNVDEADIGRIRVGDRVTFTVDAFPARPFSGQVVQIRKAPQVVQNVVTYNVVVGVQNPDLKLLPGMTANVRIVVDQKPSVLKVPNAALRFRPQGVQADGPARGGPQGRPGGGPAAPTAQGRGPAGRAWVVGADGKPQAVNLQLGISDGNFTEVLDGALAEGQEVIVGSTERPATAPAGAPRLRL
ncbi:MAG: efflux RND transporter periplasmic adaptor subunit [candidate division NC10 bacterium]